MPAKPLPPFADFLSGVLTQQFYRPPVRPEPGTRIQFPSPCEEEGCEACTGRLCHCACHLLENAQPDITKEEDERDAEVFANRISPEGCTCPNNGGGDCPWCRAKEDWLINDPAWRLEALGGL